MQSYTIKIDIIDSDSLQSVYFNTANITWKGLLQLIDQLQTYTRFYDLDKEEEQLILDINLHRMEEIIDNVNKDNNR